MKTRKQIKVFVAMSGGVDSSVAALLLKNRGYDITGVFMRCFSTESGADSCAAQDAEDARRVAEHLDIPFYVWDFEKEYKDRVMEYMVRGYADGITPNPDVMCNKEIKFGLFLETALRMGADHVATGHYVRLRTTIDKKRLTNNKAGVGEGQMSPVNCQLFSARDASKDQSYFLWTLTQEQLQRCLFPVGDYLKPKVRALAQQAGLPVAKKKDSQGICFLGQVSLSEFLSNRIPSREGPIVTAQGERVGVHKGAEFYTIGQRHLGASINYPSSNFEKPNRERKPLYVAAKSIKANSLTVVEGDDDPLLYKNEVELSDVNFPASFMVHHSSFIAPVLARVRYRQPLFPSKLSMVNGQWSLAFAKPVKFVASGQSAVIYDAKGRLLGGGIIAKSK